MKQNYLFKIPVLQLVTLAFIVFLLQACQGCCKYCTFSVSKQKMDSLSMAVHKENDQKESQIESIAIAKPIEASEPIIIPLQEIDNKNNSLQSEENIHAGDYLQAEIITIADTSIAYPLPSSPLIEKSSIAYAFTPATRDRQYIQKDKINTAMLPVGKGCPFGIRSITSHFIAGPNVSFKSSKEGDDVYGDSEHKHQPGGGFSSVWARAWLLRRNFL